MYSCLLVIPIWGQWEQHPNNWLWSIITYCPLPFLVPNIPTITTSLSSNPWRQLHHHGHSNQHSTTYEIVLSNVLLIPEFWISLISVNQLALAVLSSHKHNDSLMDMSNWVGTEFKKYIPWSEGESWAEMNGSVRMRCHKPDIPCEFPLCRQAPHSLQCNQLRTAEFWWPGCKLTSASVYVRTEQQAPLWRQWGLRPTVVNKLGWELD